jgi:hypothetical protein
MNCKGLKEALWKWLTSLPSISRYEGSMVKPSAKQALQEVQNALHYFPLKENAWQTQALCIDALLQVRILMQLNQSIVSFFQPPTS